MISEIYFKLTNSFPGGFLSGRGEFIAHKEANEYFNFMSCKDELEVKCKVLEWLSRGASKREPFKSIKKNKEFNNFMLNGINTYLGTNFTTEDMRIIYQELGNQVNRTLTVKFIESKYDLDVIDSGKESENK